MSTSAYSLYFDRRESLRGTIWVSIGLHAVLFVSVVVYTMLGPRRGNRWGQAGSGTGSAVKVNAVSSLPSIPLPTPALATPNTLATQNPGLHHTEPLPKPVPIPQELIPKFKDAIKSEKAERVNKRIQKQQPTEPENAVPYGLGGQPAPSSVPFTMAGGSEGGLDFGPGNFSERYGWYVQAIKTRISNNWLLSTISPNLSAAPRVYVTFNILRDGTIADVQVQQSSGFPEVDRSALRAVMASSPLAPLPPDYRGSSILVKFYFDFHR
jgi:TonB family protein